MPGGRSVPIVSQTEIYPDEMAVPEPPPLPEPGGAWRPRLGPQQLGRVAAPMTMVS
jgi:hypothetical protein